MTLADLKSKVPVPKQAVSGRFVVVGALVGAFVIVSLFYGHFSRARQVEEATHAQHIATVASETASAPPLPSVTSGAALGWSDALAKPPQNGAGGIVNGVKGAASEGFDAISHPLGKTGQDQSSTPYHYPTSDVTTQPAPVDPQVELRAKLLERKLAREQEAMEAPTGIATQHASSSTQTQGTLADPLLAEIAKLQAMRNSSETQHPAMSTSQMSDKEKFAETVKGGILPAVRVPPASQFVLKRGEFIPATLPIKINSDLPGDIVALVPYDVLDTPTGKWKLIPAGSKLIGQYNANISYGQNRTQVAWTAINFPDGSSIDLGRMPGHDADGTVGLSGKTNNHLKRLVGGVVLSSVMAAGLAVSQNRSSSNSVLNYPSVGQQAASSVAQQAIQSGMQITNRNLNVQPTLTNEVGKIFPVFVERDIIFAGPYEDMRK